MSDQAELERIIEQEAQQDPSYTTNPAIAYFDVGLGARLDMEYEKAELALRKAIELDPTYALSYQILGMAYTEHAFWDREKAMECFSRVIQLGCKGTDLEIDEENPYFQLSLCYEELKKFEEAKDAYKKSIELAPHHYESYLGLGRLYHMENDYLAAVETYQKAVSVCEQYDPKFLESILLKNIRFNLDRVRNKLPYQEYQPSEEEKLLDIQLERRFLLD